MDFNLNEAHKMMEESAENVLAALGLAAEELKVGFKKVRKAITEDK